MLTEICSLAIPCLSNLFPYSPSDFGQVYWLTLIIQREAEELPNGCFSFPSSPLSFYSYLTKAGSAVVTKAGSAVVTEAGSAVVTEAGSAVVTKAGSAVVTQAGSAVVTEAGSAVDTEA